MFSMFSKPLSRGGPALGEHTGEVMMGILGMSRAEVEALAGDGTLC
jgi:hypothetical protein